MIKQQEVIIESIYSLGKLINPELDIEEVRRILGVNLHQEDLVELRSQDFNFTGKSLAYKEALPEKPDVDTTEIDTTLRIRDCHKDEGYKFSEDGRIYADFLNGYIKPQEVDNQNTVQITVNRTVINIPEDFIRYYVLYTDMEQSNKILEDALLTIRSNTDKEERKRNEELRKQRCREEREKESERYHYHTKTNGMYLLHTPYILTEEGRVFDTELGRLRAVNNREYTTGLTKGFTVPVNLSIDNIKNILENKDFKILISRTHYSEDQCNSMWEDYQKRVKLKEDSEDDPEDGSKI